MDPISPMKYAVLVAALILGTLVECVRDLGPCWFQ